MLDLLSDGLLDAVRPGTVVVVCLDAPLSGGRPAAQARTLTALVGSPDEALERCRPVFETSSAHVVPTGGVGAGQWAELFDNGLLILDQSAVTHLSAVEDVDVDVFARAMAAAVPDRCPTTRPHHREDPP